MDSRSATLFWRLPRTGPSIAAALLLLGTVGCGPRASAEGSARSPGEADNIVASVILSAQLVRYARTHSDPMAMMVAGKMLAKAKAVAPGADGKPAGGAPAEQALPSAAALFSEARQLAGERPDFIAIIEEAGASGSRGVVESVGTITGRLGAKESTTRSFTFAGDSDAAAGVASPLAKRDKGDGDLDLYVTDDKGASVCVAESPGMPELCRWTPKRSGTFTLKLTNRLTSSTDYVLIVK